MIQGGPDKVDFAVSFLRCDASNKGDRKISVQLYRRLERRALGRTGSFQLRSLAGSIARRQGGGGVGNRFTGRELLCRPSRSRCKSDSLAQSSKGLLDE